MIFNKIYKSIEKDGLGETIKKIERNIISRFYIKKYLYEIDLKNFDENKLKKYNYFFKEIDEEILLKLNQIEEIPKFKIEILRDRIKNYKETLNYVAINESNKIVGHFCLALKNIRRNPYINKYLKIAEDSTYCFDDYTIEKFRKKGVHLASLEKRLKESKKLGFKKSIVVIYCSNLPSQKTYEKMGFKKKMYLHEIKIFNNKFLLRSKLKNGDM